MAVVDEARPRVRTAAGSRQQVEAWTTALCPACLHPRLPGRAARRSHAPSASASATPRSATRGAPRTSCSAWGCPSCGPARSGWGAGTSGGCSAWGRGVPPHPAGRLRPDRDGRDRRVRHEDRGGAWLRRRRPAPRRPASACTAATCCASGCTGGGRTATHMRRVVAVGHRAAVADLIRQLRRERYHGMEIVAACLPMMLARARTRCARSRACRSSGDFNGVGDVVEQTGAGTVAVLACPEIDGVALRRLAWQLEKDDVDLVVAPALMEVAGPRTSIRPVAGLPLLHVEHPELSGGRRLAKTHLRPRRRERRADPPVAPAGVHRDRDPHGQQRPGAVPAGTRRPRRPRVHRAEVPYDGRRRRATQGRAASSTTTTTASCSRSGTIRASPVRAPGCAATPSTSCRS